MSLPLATILQEMGRYRIPTTPCATKKPRHSPGVSNRVSASFYYENNVSARAIFFPFENLLTAVLRLTLRCFHFNLLGSNSLLLAAKINFFPQWIPRSLLRGVSFFQHILGGMACRPHLGFRRNCWETVTGVHKAQFTKLLQKLLATCLALSMALALISSALSGVWAMPSAITDSTEGTPKKVSTDRI